MQLIIMVDPVLLTLGPLTISWPGLGNALGLILAVAVSLALARHRGVPLVASQQAAAAGVAVGVAAGLLVDSWLATGCGLMAAALVVAWNTDDHFFGKEGTGTSSFPEGESLPAANLASRGEAKGEGRPRREEIPQRLGAVWQTTEVCVPGLLLGQAVGHVGNFLAGNEWGRTTGGLWGVVYWHPHALLPPPLLGIHLYPFALYAAAVDVMVAGLWLVLGRNGMARVRPWLTLAGYTGCHLALNVIRGGESMVWRH